MAPYPTKEELFTLFKGLEVNDWESVFKRVSPNVDWTIMGTHPLAGHYTTFQDFYDSSIKRLALVMREPGFNTKVRNVIGGGDQEWAAIELVIRGTCKNGTDLPFENTYSWNMRFDTDGIAVEVRAYLDSFMVKQAIEENEVPSRRAPLPQL